MKSIAPLMRKKWLLAVIAAAVVGSGAYAFAATLGVSSATLGAGNHSVTSCADSAKATYTTAYDPALTAGHFAVGSVTLTFGAGTTCATGDKLEVVLQDGSNVALASYFYTVGSTDTLATKAVTVTAASTTPSGNGWVNGTASAGTDGTDFTSSTAATTASTAISAQTVAGIAVSAVGAAANAPA